MSTLASGIDARRAETTVVGSVHESPAARDRVRGAQCDPAKRRQAVDFFRLPPSLALPQTEEHASRQRHLLFRAHELPQRQPHFGIKQADRLSHMYVIGKTGVGKSTLLKTLALQDFEAGRGFALIDPHGDLVEALAEGIAALDPERLVYLNAADPWQPYGYNPLRRVRDDKIRSRSRGLLENPQKALARCLGRAHGACAAQHAVRASGAGRCQTARYSAALRGR